MCLASAPELFEQDDTGYAVILNASPGPDQDEAARSAEFVPGGGHPHHRVIPAAGPTVGEVAKWGRRRSGRCGLGPAENPTISADDRELAARDSIDGGTW
jgi:hypothetical protein